MSTTLMANPHGASQHQAASQIRPKWLDEARDLETLRSLVRDGRARQYGGVPVERAPLAGAAAHVARHDARAQALPAARLLRHVRARRHVRCIGRLGTARKRNQARRPQQHRLPPVGNERRRRRPLRLPRWLLWRTLRLLAGLLCTWARNL